MADSRRQQILEAVKTRLAAIQIADDFQTDAGLAIFLGETPALGPDDPEMAIAIVPSDDVIKVQMPGKKLLLSLPINVQALAKADLDTPWAQVEAVIHDIKTAMELTDLTLGGLVEQQLRRGQTRTLPREPGSTTVGASIVYLVEYAEQWGAP